MERHDSFLNHQQQQLCDPSYQNSLSYLPRSETIPMDETFEKLHDSCDNYFSPPESSTPYLDNRTPTKFASDASMNNLPFPLQCFPNESSHMLTNNQQEVDDMEVLPDLPPKDAPSLESSTFADSKSGDQNDCTDPERDPDCMDTLKDKNVAIEDGSNVQNDMPDLSSDYYDNGKTQVIELSSNGTDTQDKDDFDSDKTYKSKSCIDKDDAEVCSRLDSSAVVDDNDSRVSDIEEEAASVLDSCLDIVELMDDTCASVNNNDESDLSSFPSVVLPNLTQKRRRRKMNWGYTRRTSVSRKKSKDKVLYATPKETAQQETLTQSLENVEQNSQYLQNSMLQSAQGSDMSSSTGNYNLVGVAEYSMLGPPSSDRLLATTINNNMRLLIKEERTLSPDPSIDNMSSFPNESDESERDSAFVIKEMVSTLNNILGGNTTVQKYVDADFDRFEIINHESGSLVTVTSNCRSQEGFQSARRALSGMRYFQNGGRNPDDSSSLKQCFVKLNRIGNEDENSEEAASAFSTPALEMDDGLQTSVAMLSEPILDGSLPKRKCNRCHYVFTEKHFESHVCRYCATCQKVFANVSGFRKHQRYYCPAAKLDKSESSQADPNEIPQSPEKPSKADDGPVTVVGRNLVSCEKCGHAFAKASIGRHRCTFCLICHSTSGRCKHIKPPETPSPAKTNKGSNGMPSKSVAMERTKRTTASTYSRKDTSGARSSRANSMLEDEEDVEEEEINLDFNGDNNDDVNYKVPLARQSTLSSVRNNANTRKKGGGVYCQYCERRYPNRLFMRRHQLKDKCNSTRALAMADDAYSSPEEKTPLRKQQESESRMKIKAETSTESRYNATRSSRAATAAVGKRPRFFMDSDSNEGSDNEEVLGTRSSSWKKQDRRMLSPPLRSEEQHQEKFSCNYCYMIFSSFIQYKSHIQMHIDENSHECPYCLERFPNQFALKDHVRIHIQGSRIVCRECGERFPTQKLYYKHMLQKH